MRKIVFGALTTVALSFTPTTYAAYDDIYPSDAYDAATTDADTYIVDIRGGAERVWVGRPGEDGEGNGATLDGKVVDVSWMLSRNKNKVWVQNHKFVREIEDIFPDKENVTLIVMCRNGGRGKDAAAALDAAGYENVMNMVQGFEGSRDDYGYHTVNGWKNTMSSTGNYPLPYYFSGPKDPDAYD